MQKIDEVVARRWLFGCSKEHWASRPRAVLGGGFATTKPEKNKWKSSLELGHLKHHKNLELTIDITKNLLCYQQKCWCPWDFLGFHAILAGFEVHLRNGSKIWVIFTWGPSPSPCRRTGGLGRFETAWKQERCPMFFLEPYQSIYFQLGSDFQYGSDTWWGPHFWWT